MTPRKWFLFAAFCVPNLGAGSACAPRATTHRRVITDSLPSDPGPASELETPESFSRSSGARNQDVRGPAGTPRVLWRTDLGTPLVHDLVPWNDVVYTTGGGEVFCIRADGAECWRSAANAVGGLAVRAAGLDVPTSEGSMLHLSLADGSLLTTYDAGGVISGSPVVLAEELVWVTTDGRVVAETDWAVSASDSSVGTAAADEQHLYFGTQTGELVATSRAQTRWRAVLPGPMVGGVIAASGLVFAAYTSEDGLKGGVTALSAVDGAVVWRMPLSDIPAAGPALGTVLVVADRRGEVVGFDPQTGDVVWTIEVGGAPTTAPTFGLYGLYLGNADGRLHRFDPDDGGEVWSIQLGATPSAAPAVLSGLVIVGLSDGSLVAVGSP